MSRKILKIFSSLIMIMLMSTSVQAQQLLEEVQERARRKAREDAERVQREQNPRGRWASNIFVSYGYDTNPRLTALRKGDHYETLRLNLDYRRTFMDKNQISFTTNLSGENYNEITDLSNFLGDSNLMFKHALSKHVIFGVGYDISYAEYPFDEESSYTFHNFYTNVQHRLTDNLYHQLEYEFGLKYFSDALAINHTLFAFQDKERKDIRNGLEYSLGYIWNNRLSSNLRLKGSYNNSNSFFQDYYDYYTYEAAPRLYYKISDQLASNFSFSYLRRLYVERLESTDGKKQHDNIYITTLGLNYSFKPQHRLTLDYTYQENESNDDASDYTSSAVEAGYRYIF